jgi:hypothetical protein
MDPKVRQTFLFKWHKYFPGAELPITFEYTDEERQATTALASQEARCLIAMLRRVRAGESLSFSTKSFGCAGGRFYTGYSPRLRTDIAEFLSCGRGQELEGERYKKNPEVAAMALREVPWYEAPAAHLVAKRFDMLEEADEPAVVVFFATPDVLAGLFTLCGYDEPGLNDGAITPFGSGCASVVQYPFVESRREHPRAVIGLFDISARPYVGPNELSFAVPWKKFSAMVANMEESFLITHTWEQVRERIAGER